RVLLSLQTHVENHHPIVISAITYAELRFGAIGKKASAKHNIIVDEFLVRIDSVLAWDQVAVEASASIKKTLSDKGVSIGNNDTMIAGHAISTRCVLVTNNVKEFSRVPGLTIEDWV
ncbi:MAG: type II toxin-antitoxin system VapC family toxin, partial [Thiohalomonadales bacterium]